jgi:hypothetical protein
MSFRLRWTAEAGQTFQGRREAAERAAANRLKANAGGKGKGKAKSSKQEGLFKQVAKAVELLAAEPRHSGLNTREYDSLQNLIDPKGKVFEAYAQNKTPGAYRIFWCHGPERGEITSLAITPYP